MTLCLTFSLLLTSGVKIDDNPRGPAVGITISTKKGEIDIDLSPSVDVTDIKLKGWPNAGSTVFDSEKGKEIKQQVGKAQIHLVPKKDLFWRISYSKKMKALINSMDRIGECRKRCHKMLKYDFQIWKTEEKCRFEGISTYLFYVSILETMFELFQLFFWEENLKEPGQLVSSKRQHVIFDTRILIF